MKTIYKGLFTLCSALVLLSHPVLAADDDEQYVEQRTAAPEHLEAAEQKSSIWNAQLSGGWDSLYMFRGVNKIREKLDYGSSIFWADLNVTLHLTPTDSLTAGVWSGFGLYDTNYKETDLSLTYTHTIGDLFFSLGYEFYDITSAPQYANELQGKIGYNLSLGPVILTPSVSYFFNLGPSANETSRGIAPNESSFLDLRLDGSVPVVKDVVYLKPWISYGQNFSYNAKTTSSSSREFFDGANSIEFGIALPIRINKIITLSGYGAYSHAFTDLVNTQPSTFWGGAEVTISF